MGKQINSPFDDVSQDVDDFDSEWLNVGDDPERVRGSDYDYDEYYSDNVEDGDSDETDKLLKDRDRRAKEYERLKSEHKELQKDIKEYNEKIREYGKKVLEAQAKNDEEHLESLRDGVDNLRQILKERKDRLNEVAKKLDYFEGKTSKSNDRWGVDPQPQLQIDDSTPAEHIVDVIEPKSSLDDVDLSKLKGRRNRRNNKGDSSTQQPSIGEVDKEVEKLEKEIVELEGKLPKGYSSRVEGDNPIDRAPKLLEKNHILSAVKGLEAMKQFTHMYSDEEIATASEMAKNIREEYGLPKKNRHISGVPAWRSSTDDIWEIDYSIGILKQIQEKKEEIAKLKSSVKSEPTVGSQPSIEELEKEINELEESLGGSEWEKEGRLREVQIYKLLEEGNVDEAMDTYDKLLWSRANNRSRVGETIDTKYGIPTLLGSATFPQEKGWVEKAHREGVVPDFSDVIKNNNLNVEAEIIEKKKLLEELKQAQKLKEESDGLDKEIENVAEELSNDPVYNKEGEFVGNTATTILSEGNEGDIDDLTWDDVEYDPIKREYYNKHTGEVVKGRPKLENETKEKPLTDEDRELFTSLFKIMDMEGEYESVRSPLVSSIDAHTASRVMSEYDELTREISEEIGKAYNELSEDVDEETKKLIWNKINGLGELKDELGKIIYREIESPGHLRAVKEAYEQAGYQSQIGDGLGQAVHHLDGYNWNVKGRNNGKNLILLSNEVHDEFHNIYGRGNNTIEQFFEFLSNYHPEDLPKFIEEYVVPNAGMFGVDEKLLEASKDWDVDTWRKQFNRFNEIPYKRHFDDEDNPLINLIPYSSFFLKNMEVPVDKYDMDGNHEITQISTRDSRVLDIYDRVSKHEKAGYLGKSDEELRKILHARQKIEVMNGILKEDEMSNLDDFKYYGNGATEELLNELDESHERGRKALEDAISGDRNLSFLGEGFEELGKNGSLDNTGLGKGLIPVIDRLKEFFEEYADITEIENPFKEWDSSKGATKENLDILNKLFDEKTGANNLLSHVLASLPTVDNRGKLTDIGDPNTQIKRIREFKEYLSDNPNATDLNDFDNAKNDLAYLIGLTKAGLSIENIGRFFSPQGKRKPLSDDDVARAFNFRPKPDSETGNNDIGLADIYEALGYNVEVTSGGLVLNRIVQKEELRENDGEIISNGNPYNVREWGKRNTTENPEDVEKLEKLSEDNLNTLMDFVPKTCCEQILDVLEEINGKINSVGKSIADALSKHGFAFGGVSSSGGESSGGSDPSKRYKNKKYSGRVKRLEELRDSTEDEEIKAFAERSLEYAKDMDSRGYYKSERNLDLVYGAYGDLDILNLSQEDIDKLSSERENILSDLENKITQSELDSEIEKIDNKITKLRRGKTYDKQGKPVKPKIEELIRDKEELLNKGIMGDDVAEFLNLKLKAIDKILYGNYGLETYKEQFNKLINAVSTDNNNKEKDARVRIKEIQKRLGLLGIDTSEVIEESVDKVDRTIRYYREQLKKTKDPSEKVKIEDKIKNLKALKKEISGEEEENPYSKYGQFNPNIPHPSEESLDNETWRVNPDVVNKDEELLRMEAEIEHLKVLRDAVKSEYTRKALTEQIKEKTLNYNARKKKLSSLTPSDVYDHIEHEKSESHADIFDTRWNFLREQFAKNKERLEYFQGLSSDLLGEDWVNEEYEKTLKKLEKIKTAIHTLRGEDGYDYDKHEDAINRIGGEFEKVAISIDEAIKKAKEFEREVSEGAEAVEERNRVALGHLFGEDFEWNKDGTAKTPKTTTSTEKAPLEGRLTRMAYNFRQASQSANQFSGVLTKLFSIVGTGNALNDMITASSLRQTNQIMLASSRGMEEAKKLYDRIQMLVVKLPGNDTFLTNILTMLGTMDKALSAEDLEYMGGVIADYYMGAQAKGQFNNETERELRNYLMTGQTRNLTNSIIASEIESLKGLNSIKERTVALEKALQATGMDSIAHYDSYTNSLEEFKGRFQKAFADLGDLYLGFLQGGMKVYNFIDNLTNSTLSQFVITIAVSVMGLLAFFGVMAELLSMSAGLIEAFDVMNKLITDTDKQYSGLAQTFRKVITWIAFKTGVINADTASQVINTDATIASTISQELNTLGIMGNVVAKLTSAVTNIRLSITAYISMWSRLAELDATTLETIAELGNTKVKIIARLVTYRQIIANTLNTISTLILAGALRSTTKEYMRYVKAKIESALIDTLIIALEWGATIATMAWYGATLLLSGALTIVSALLSPVGLLILGIVGAVWLLVKAFEGVGQIFGWWTNIGEMFQAIGDGIHRVWDAFMNSEPVQYIVATFQNLTYTLGVLFNWIGSIGGNIWQTIFGTGDGTKQVFDIVGVFLEIVGFIGKLAFLVSPLRVILDVINAIGSAIAWFLDTWNQFVDSAEFQGIIKDFQEIRAVIGEAWGTLSEAFNEVREAFMSVFEDDEDMKNAVETTNILLDVLRAVATFLRITIIPIIKFIAYVIKGIADVVKFVVDIGVGVIDFFTGGSLTQDSSNLVNQSQLAQSYSHQISNAQTIINNNFASGSVLTDARNMTAKEVMKLFTSAFGFNKARGVNGVIN